MMMPEKKKKPEIGDWAWGHGEAHYCEGFHGPFSSREDALADAIDHLPPSLDSEPHPIAIGQITRIPSIVDALAGAIGCEQRSASTLLELAEERIADEYGSEDGVINLSPAAEAALGCSLVGELSRWAMLYEKEISVDWFVVDKAETEMVRPVPRCERERVPEGYEATIANAWLDHICGDSFLYHPGCVGPFQDGTNPCTVCQSRAKMAADVCDYFGQYEDAATWRELIHQWEHGTSESTDES